MTKSYPLKSPDEIWEALTEVQPANHNLDDHINASLATFLLDHHEETLGELLEEDCVDVLEEVAYDG